MITQKTVFILGAGASCPFGFPTGPQLRDEITSLIGTSLTLGDKIFEGIPESLKIFETCGHTFHELITFSENLIWSQKNSIDAFLEHRPEFIKLGKRLITFSLIGYESLDAIYKNPDWYNYLWNKLNAKFEDFDKNQVSFITFNYDRTLEIYLISSMMALYNRTSSECYEKLKKIPIIHVHGKLGKNEVENDKYFIGSGKNISSHIKLMEAAESIKIIHEDISNDKEFIVAQDLISNADKIIILGLGYDESNLTRLKITDANGRIQGSSFGLTQMECQSIQRKFPINFSPYNHHKALEFLRHSVMME